MNNKFLLHIFIVAMLAFFSPKALAAGGNNNEPFNPTTFIFGHIADAYDFHITTIGEKHISIPLLVIVKGKENGFKVFSSSKVTHGHNYEGFHIETDGEYKGKLVEVLSNGSTHRPLDLSITKNVNLLLYNI